jgi:hypothetical protein
MSDLVDLRTKAAEREFQNYEFGDDNTVEAANGWESDSGDDEVSRVVFFAPRESDEDQSTSVRGHFTVVFQPGTAEVLEAYATCDGEDVGYRPDPDAPAAPRF